MELVVRALWGWVSKVSRAEAVRAKDAPVHSHRTQAQPHPPQGCSARPQRVTRRGFVEAPSGRVSQTGRMKQKTRSVFSPLN